MASPPETPDNADVSIASSPRSPRVDSFPDPFASDQHDTAATPETTSRPIPPPSFQEMLMPCLTLTVQISKAEEVVETIQVLRDTIPHECAPAAFAFDQTLHHLNAALRDLHRAHDRVLNVLRTNLGQHSSTFGRLPLMDAD
eukprot:s176_g5.t1